MTVQDIRAKLDIYTQLNARGEDKQVGFGSGFWYPIHNGGCYNGFVSIPTEYLKYFHMDEWGHMEDIPEVHGGVSFFIHDHKNKTFSVGFDTLHHGDTEEYWTLERTIEEAGRWADEIAKTIYNAIEKENGTDK